MEYKRVATCSDRIKEALRARGKKQADLCQITKIPKSALSQYLSGAYEPKQDRIYLISKALNVNEAWLMGLDVPMERQRSSPPETELTEGEKMLLELFRRIPEERQPEALELLRVALRMQKKL